MRHLPCVCLSVAVTWSWPVARLKSSLLCISASATTSLKCIAQHVLEEANTYLHLQTHASVSYVERLASSLIGFQVYSIQPPMCVQTISNAHGPSAAPSYAGLIMGLLPYQVTCLFAHILDLFCFTHQVPVSTRKLDTASRSQACRYALVQTLPGQFQADQGHKCSQALLKHQPYIALVEALHALSCSACKLSQHRNIVEL